MEYYSGYNFNTNPQLRECLKELHIMYGNSIKSNLQAIKEKYSHMKYSKVAEIIPPKDFPIL